MRCESVFLVSTALSAVAAAAVCVCCAAGSDYLIPNPSLVAQLDDIENAVWNSDAFQNYNDTVVLPLRQQLADALQLPLVEIDLMDVQVRVSGSRHR
jgi:hypothetical protein